MRDAQKFPENGSCRIGAQHEVSANGLRLSMSVIQMEGRVFGTLAMRITAIKGAKLGQRGWKIEKLGNQMKIHIFLNFHFSLKRLIFSPNDLCTQP